MPDPRLKRGAFLRLGFVVAIGPALFAPCRAHADEASQFPCGAIERAKEMVHAMGGGDFVALTNDQFQFVRGLFVMAPDTPASLPPGDHAEMSLRPDGSASIIFVDGDRACAPIKLGPEAIRIVMQVGAGDLVHAGRGL
ncbi:MAG: hypothetical protein ABSA66_21515 [Roseiarcus sp.]|jgi:hypothetical protein